MKRNRRYDPNEKNDRVDTMGSNVYSAKDKESVHNSLNGEFLLYQTLLRELLNENNSFQIKSSLLRKYFRPIDSNDKQVMEEFDTEYKPDKAIHWYTRESCIYKILNKALRTQNIDDIMPFDQFIRDLNKQLADEHGKFVKQQKTSTIQVYRGQLISIDEVNRLKTGKGQLLSINSFLSTSTNRQKALEFATSRPPPNDKLTSILLEIKVDLQAICKPYADIKHLSAFAEEEEILFMFGCVFRIDNVVYDENKKIWMGSFTVCSEKDSDYKAFNASLDNQVKEQNPFMSLGNYLIEMQKYNEAEEHFNKMLKYELVKCPFVAAYCYHGLAQVNIKKQDYTSAVQNLKKSLDFLFEGSSLISDHLLIPQCYNDLGLVYTEQRDYISAFQYYEKAIRTKNNNKLTTYLGLATIHDRCENYFLALEYLEKALQNKANVSDSFVAHIYIQFGNIYTKLNDKEKSSEMFQTASKLQGKALSPDHPDMGYTYMAMSEMATKTNDDKAALEYIDKAFQIQSQSLPEKHGDFAETYTKYGDFYERKGDYTKALTYYHKGLDNQLLTLSWFHPAVTQTYLTIGLIHEKTKNYDEAFVYFNKALKSELERKKPGDLSLTVAYTRIADLHYKLNHHDQALDFYRQGFENEILTKLPEDFSLVTLYNVISELHAKKGALDQALLYKNRVLDCYLRQQPVNQESIKQIYTAIGNIYLKKTNFDQIFLYYRKMKISSSRDIENVHFERRHLDLALHYFEKVLQQTQQKDPKNDLLINNTNQIIANIFYEKEFFKQSLDYYFKLLKKLLKKTSKDDASLANIYFIIGQIYFRDEDYNQSAVYLYRYIDCLLKTHDLRSPNVYQIYLKIGEIYLKKGILTSSSNYVERLISKKKADQWNSDFRFEQRHLEQSIEFFRRLLHKKIFRDLKEEDILLILANLHSEKEDFHQSLSFLQQLYQYVNQTNPLNYQFLGKINEIMAAVIQKLGNTGQALQIYREAIVLYKKVRPFNQDLIDKVERKIHKILLPSDN